MKPKGETMLKKDSFVLISIALRIFATSVRFFVSGSKWIIKQFSQAIKAY